MQHTVVLDLVINFYNSDNRAPQIMSGLLKIFIRCEVDLK